MVAFDTYPRLTEINWTIQNIPDWGFHTIARDTYKGKTIGKHRNGKLTPGRKRIDNDRIVRDSANQAQSAAWSLTPDAIMPRAFVRGVAPSPVRRIFAHSSGGSPG